MSPSGIEVLATVLFAVAMAHTFSVHQFNRMARGFRPGGVGENLFHLLGEVEVVFGFWAAVLLIAMAVSMGYAPAVHYVESRDFTEPAFVFVIMAIAATRPVLQLAAFVINAIASLLPMQRERAFYFSILVIGPLLGSFITEPGAMTVCALILKDRVFDRGVDRRFMYLTLGILFVNVSIGGVLTPYAAPPVVMVAGKFGWGLEQMLREFGWKSVIAVALNAAMGLWYGWNALFRLAESESVPGEKARVPGWMMVVHVGFLALVVITGHHMQVFMGVFLFFLGVVAVTREHQDAVKLRESLLVGFFLGGLVTLGGLQRWWLEPLLNSLGATSLYLGAAGLTAVTDNAALTYLGSQVPHLSETMKYALVAGSVVGGGLTVIANAPNPAGYSILRSSFGKDGISPLGLLVGAAVPTVVAVILFWVLPIQL